MTHPSELSLRPPYGRTAVRPWTWMGRWCGQTPASIALPLAILAACGSADDRSPGTVLIYDCSDCALVVTEGPDIGTATGAGMIASDESRAVRDSRGRYYLLSRIYGEEVAVFDSSGRYLQTIGREGEGPGEFTDIAKLLITPGDSLVVLDWAARLTLFGPDHQLVRTVPLPLSPQIIAALTPDGGVVVGLLRPSEGSANDSLQPLHHVSRDGVLLRSFGDAGEVYDATVPYNLSRTVASADGNAVWSAWRMPYRIDRYDLDTGELTTSLVRRAGFFPSITDEVRRANELELKPMPMIASIQQDTTGLLWVLLYLPDPDWRSAVKVGTGPHGTITDYDRYHDTRVEVIDPVRGTLVGYHHFDEYVSHLVAPGIVATVAVRDTTAVLRTWQLRVER